MKLLQSILISLLMAVTTASHAVSQDVQVDLLMTKIATALKENRAADALPTLQQLESMAPVLKKPLPETYHYYYVDALDRMGDKDKALSRAAAYLNTYGQKEKHYSQVIEIMGRLQDAADKSATSGKLIHIPGKDYELGEYEVTQGQWKAVMGNNPSHFSNCGDNCPVEEVNWDDIQAFLQKLNAMTGKQYRLPTEAEWVYACYGGSQTEYCGGNNISDVSWYYGNSSNTTHPTGKKFARGYGLYDLSGNVAEWTSDCWEDDCDKRVLRGGSWYSEPQEVRAEYRYGVGVENRDYGLGFRLARTLP